LQKIRISNHGADADYTGAATPRRPRAALCRKILEAFDAARPAMAIDRPEMRLLRLTLFDGNGTVGKADGVAGMHLDGIKPAAGASGTDRPVVARARAKWARDSFLRSENQICELSRMRGWESDSMKLESMSTAELEALRATVEAMIADKIAERRQHLETELAKLAGIFGERTARNAKATTRTSAAKYRNPDNVTEIWSGRGRRPLWLDAQLKAGKDLELFLAA
jgi:DNA-binding protein H-NS